MSLPRRPGLDQVRVDPCPFWGLLSRDAEDGRPGLDQVNAEDGVLSQPRPRREGRPGRGASRRRRLPSPDDAPTPRTGSGPCRSPPVLGTVVPGRGRRTRLTRKKAYCPSLSLAAKDGRLGSLPPLPPSPDDAPTARTGSGCHRRRSIDSIDPRRVHAPGDCPNTILRASIVPT